MMSWNLFSTAHLSGGGGAHDGEEMFHAAARMKPVRHPKPCTVERSEVDAACESGWASGRFELVACPSCASAGAGAACIKRTRQDPPAYKQKQLRDDIASIGWKMRRASVAQSAS